MSTDNMSNDDSIFEDAKAAYAEAAGRSIEAEATEPAERGSADKGADATSQNSDDKGSNRALPARGERGKFVKKGSGEPTKAHTAGSEPAETEEAEEENEAPAASVAAETATQPAGGPPPSWSVKSKSAWEQLPAEVRADIAKRETEVAQGLSSLREYKDLKPYAEMAGKQGTTIKKALDSYLGIESLLRQDIGKGLAQIVQNFGLDQAKAAALFTDLARRYGGRPGTQAALPGTTPQAGDPLHDILKPFIGPLQSEVQSLREKLTSREAADRNASEQSLAKAIEAFSARPENRYYAELEDTITKLFQSGMVPLTGNNEHDLRTAYDTAAQIVPDVREALIDQRIREQTASQRQKELGEAQRAKNASRSMGGSRVPGTVTRPATEANGHDDIEADVRAAYRMHAQH
jgi:hypothetical protein